MDRPLITFLSDYSLEDPFVGICHAVIARIAPEALVIDLTHGLPRHDVRRAAVVLRDALPYSAPGVHLAVVDPGVGTTRRALAARTADEGRVLVGPDNGLLSLTAARFGGIVEAVDIARGPFRLEPVSATFHGRDVFAPAAAHLALGAELAEAGEPVDPDEIEQIELLTSYLQDGCLVAHVLTVDRFGNAQLDVTHDALAETGLRLGHPVELEIDGETHSAHFAVTFADVAGGEALIYEDASRHLAIAVNRGDAAVELALAPDVELRLRPA